MADEYDYLTAESNKVDIKNIAALGETLKQLKAEMLAAAVKAEEAKKKYEHFAKTVVPQEMAACGIESLSLATGGTLSLKRDYFCSPNKNDADRKIIFDWLRKYNGEYLVESSGKVSSEDFTKLKESDIPFIEEVSFNTNKLKAFLKSGIGVSKNSGIQKFAIEDIPSCIHFQEVTTVEVDM